MVTIPNLQKLDVRFEITPDLAKQMSQSIKKLKHLEVKSRLESHVLQSFRFSQLESFEGIILLKNENDIFKFTKSCSKIRILVIRYLAKSDHSQKNFSIVKIVDNITKNLKDLKHLEIDCGDCRKTEKVRDLIEKVIRNSPHLLCLKLSGLFDPVKPSQYMRLAEEMPLINFEIIEH